MQTYEGTTELYLMGSRALLIRVFEIGDCSSIYIRKRCRPGRTTSSPEDGVQVVIALCEGYRKVYVRMLGIVPFQSFLILSVTWPCKIKPETSSPFSASH